MSESTKGEVQIAVMANDVATIKNEVTEIKKKLEENYVTQDQFEPVRKIVYGLVGLVLTTVVIALLYLVVKQ